MKRISLHFLAWLFLCLAGSAVAELPPLSPEMKQEQAAFVVVAEIGESQSEEVTTQSGFINTVYSVQVVVHEVKKGEGLHPGDALVCTYWKASRRPRGWVGPGGQYEHLKKGSKVCLFLHQAEGRKYALLTPNGWDKL